MRAHEGHGDRPAAIQELVVNDVHIVVSDEDTVTYLRSAFSTVVL